MEIKVSAEELRKKKLFVATPMYGGQCAGMFGRSMSDLTSLCIRYGIEMKFYSLFNESLITRARNYCCDEFVRSGYTHMLFIDSDIGFNANDVIAMLALQSDESPYDIIAAPYPKKCISWEKIKQAVDKGMDFHLTARPTSVSEYFINFSSNAKSTKQFLISNISSSRYLLQYLCNVLNLEKSFSVYSVKVASVLSLAVFTALFVKDIKAILLGLTPLLICPFNTFSIKVYVFPVPGGPNILTVFLYICFSFWSSKLSCVILIIHFRYYVFTFSVALV